MLGVPENWYGQVELVSLGWSVWKKVVINVLVVLCWWWSAGDRLSTGFKDALQRFFASPDDFPNGFLLLVFSSTLANGRSSVHLPC